MPLGQALAAKAPADYRANTKIKAAPSAIRTPAVIKGAVPRFGLDAGGFQCSRSSPSGKQMKAQRRKLFSKNSQMLFVTVVYAEENRTLARQALPRRKLGFRKRLSVRRRNSHDFAR